MTARLHLVPDTNLLMQCRPLSELPWSDITDSEEITLDISRPVQAEIDAHKSKGSGRLSRRARTASALLRKTLREDDGCTVIRNAEPRVTLVIRNDLRPDPDLTEQLDYSERDDQLVGIVHAFASGNQDGPIKLLTHDTGPMASARMVGVEYIEIPDTWLLPPETDDAQRMIATLEAENRRLRSAEPKFTIRLEDAEGEKINSIEQESVKYKPLTNAQIDDLMRILRERYPMERDFGSPERERKKSPLEIAAAGLYGSQVYRAVTEAEARNYTDKDYPAWLAECEKRLREIHLFLSLKDGWPKANFVANNCGTRPARDTLVSIVALGNIAIMPSSSEPGENDDTDDEDENEGPASPAGYLRLPPTPPRGRWEVRSLVDPFRASRAWQFDRSFVEPPYTQALLNRLAKEHDPNAFYWKPEKPETPSERLTLSCEQWRHGIGDEAFEIEIWHKPNEPEVTGALEFSIHADNLTDPMKLTVPVRISIIERESLNEAEKMISGLGQPRLLQQRSATRDS